MHVRFWGTRGSIAKPGPTTVRYGGNTSCVEVRSARGTLVVIDCGTGAHSLGQSLIAGGVKGLRGHILISHTHWDHIQGIPFIAPLFVAGTQWDIYGPRGLHQPLREALAGQMQYTYFPVTPDQFGATIRYHDLVEGSFNIDDIKVSTHYLNHPALTLGYRLEADGATLVYSCDHEPYSQWLASGQGEILGQDLGHVEFIKEADLLIHDAQYTAAEYPAKTGWGHSSVEYVVKLGEYARVKRLALTHHDPLRDDDSVDRMLHEVRTALRARSSALEVFAAMEGDIVDVEPRPLKERKLGVQEFQAMTRLQPALSERWVLLGVTDASMAAMLSEAIRAEGIRPQFFSDIDEVERLDGEGGPSVVMLEHSKSRVNGLETCRAIRHLAGDEVPVVMIAAEANITAGAAAGVTDWLVNPFTESYARTKIRAWVLRTECRWTRASIPDNEDQRIASLQLLNILDTEPEERFDRLTRVAAALFHVPMSSISLVDRDRQWFKSQVGWDHSDTSRDASFCSHVVHTRELLVVSDTFQDSRFADNPLVTHAPRIRFYAGYPLILADGSCVGTFCLVDTRPRTLRRSDLERLHDLADLVLHELRRIA
jgi:phosphoribosyl 1,2-cyclic phosphodiesterase/CheY-like chemotaxis protein